MTPRQMKWYRGEWAKVKAVCPHFTDEDRRAIHTSVGAPESSKDFTQADLDKVLAAFWSYTKPDSLNSQLRQQEQPATRLDHRIADQLKCLALFVDHPDAYIRAVLRNRFHVEQIADLDEPNDLIQLRNTLAERLSKFRREYIGPNGTFTEHDMCARAGVPCFRTGCAECRNTSVLSELATVAAWNQDEENPF